MLAAPPPGGEPDGPDWEARIAAFMAVAEGAYSLVILTREAVFAVRDPWGLRPLCLGELPINGAAGLCRRVRVVRAGHHRRTLSSARSQPGEIVRLDRDGA